jgi:hypothetical protein
MNSTDFERARNLLPSYLKKTISDDDKAWMTQFIQNLQSESSAADNTANEARQFKDEMAWVELSQNQLEQSTPAFDSEAGWKKMAMQIDLTTPNKKTTHISSKKNKRSVFDILSSIFQAKFETLILFWRKPMVGFLASTMIVAQMGLLAALVKYSWQTQKQESAVVVPASGDGKIKDMALFSVMVKDAAKIQDMRLLLETLQAQVVSGPSAVGLWVIAVPKTKISEATSAFKASTIIESADQQ